MNLEKKIGSLIGKSHSLHSKTSLLHGVKNLSLRIRM
jgi:hypothetical protein